MKKYLCRILINEEYFQMVSKGDSAEDARNHLINAYKLNRKQIIDVCEKSDVKKYTPSYIGGSSVHVLHKPNRRMHVSLWG